MSKIDDAADQVLGLADRFRGILEVAEVIKSIGSLDQAVTERQAGLAEITQQHDAAKAELITAQAEVAALRKTQADQAARHQKDCEALYEKAAAHAADVIRQAKDDAMESKAGFEAAMRSVQQAHDEAMTEKKAELADLQSNIDAANKELAALTVTRDATAQQIAALRAKAQSVLGD